MKYQNTKSRSEFNFNSSGLAIISSRLVSSTRSCFFIQIRKNKNYKTGWEISEKSSIQLNPLWVTGFVDGEGCFSVRISKDQNLKVGWRVQLYFYIGLHVKDKALLEAITNFFGVGNIYSATESLSRYQVNSINDIKVIINHFDKYKLITNKRADFLLFKEVYNLILNKEHLTTDGLHKIVAIRASINWSITDQLKGYFPGIVPVLRPPVQILIIPDPYWLAGFACGEGCFFINLAKSKTHRLGFQIKFRFQLVQHCKDETLMRSFIEFLDCGNTYKTRDSFSYQVTKFSDIENKIIPFFTKFPILGAKSLDFSDFCRAVVIIKDDKFSPKEKLEQISQIKSGMNKGRK